MIRKPKRNIALFVFVLLAFQVYAQVQCITAGGDIQSKKVQLSYTIGQAILTATQTESFITGIQVPYERATITSVLNNRIDWMIFAYPNPTSDVLNLHVKAEHNMGYAYHLYDLTGKIRMKGILLTNLSSIDLSALEKGYYIFKINQQTNPIKSFTIIKN